MDRLVQGTASYPLAITDYISPELRTIRVEDHSASGSLASSRRDGSTEVPRRGPAAGTGREDPGRGTSRAIGHRWHPVFTCPPRRASGTYYRHHRVGQADSSDLAQHLTGLASGRPPAALHSCRFGSRRALREHLTSERAGNWCVLTMTVRAAVLPGSDLGRDYSRLHPSTCIS